MGILKTKTGKVLYVKPLMSLQNVNSCLGFTKHLVLSRAFEHRPLVVLDVGARGGFEQHWSVYDDQVRLIGFEVDQKECERLNKQASGSRKRFFPVALHLIRGKRTFFVTAHPDSSGFYPPDMEFIRRFPDETNLTVKRTIEIDTVDFDSFASENDIECLDFIKLDTEGCELDVLKGAVGALKKSVIGLSIEVEFLPIHKGQPVFRDVDSFLNLLGFRLFDLSTYRHARKALPVRSSTEMPGPGKRGQILWGQALYLRDGVDEIKKPGMLEDGWDDIRILKLASIMELFCLHDCAIELIQVAHEKGILKEVNVNHLVDLLVPRVGLKHISYNEYLKRMEYPTKTKRLVRSVRKFMRKFIIKFMPRSICHIISSCLGKLRDLIETIVLSLES